MVASLLALLLPLRSLTTARPAPLASKADPPVANTRVHLQLTSTAVPFHFEVRHLGDVIWQGEAATATTTADVSMPFPKEGVDLAVKATWTGGQTAAVKLALSANGAGPLERTIWGDGAAEDVLTFP
jgi:hypothetical protein